MIMICIRFQLWLLLQQLWQLQQEGTSSSAALLLLCNTRRGFHGRLAQLVPADILGVIARGCCTTMIAAGQATSDMPGSTATSRLQSHREQSSAPVTAAFVLLVVLIAACSYGKTGPHV
jgi:hypothetical protein